LINSNLNQISIYNILRYQVDISVTLQQIPLLIDLVKNMKAAIALLADYPVQNFARRMGYEIRQFGEVDFLSSLLPAHVSLKQHFTFESIDVLENWFYSFSTRIAPFRIELERIFYSEYGDNVIVGLKVHETPILRALHNQINHELANVVLNPSAPYDGEEYQFHLTIELAKAGSKNPFKTFYDSLPEKQVNISFKAEFIALFFETDQSIPNGSYICLKVLPLSGKE
jgi:2'-5' RNA ligase